MKVGFLIAGVQKGGTTTLDGYLRQHPAIGMARRKEPHFFDDEAAFAAGDPDYQAYHDEFDPVSNASIFGEATPIYTWWHDAPRRIWAYNPRMRLIVLLRGPIQRAWSHWKMAVRLEAETLDFYTAIREEAERCRAALPLQHRMYSYLDRGFYSEQIRRLRRFFPEDQLLFLKSETFFAAPQATLDRICRFLSVAPLAFAPQDPANRDDSDALLSEEDRRFLRERFRHDIQETEALLGWQCPDWLD